jgi:hypothetical protein
MTLRDTLARRLIQIVALSAPVAVTGCGPSSNCGGAAGAPFQACVDPSLFASEGIDAGTPANGCPAADSEAAYEAILYQMKATGHYEVQDGPTQNGGLCCYTVQPIQDCTGRPFLVEGEALHAPVARGASGWSNVEQPPHTADLSAEARAALAEAWTRDGLFEHASVASFGRFALELLAAGAPADLVDAAHRAARDEIRHAQLCLSLAGAYAGEPIAPGAFPFAGQVEVTSDLASIAARAAREGVIGETTAAVQAEEQLARATDPAVRAALAIIAADEARHAELAWRTVVWAMAKGGARVRAAVAEALASIDDVTTGGARREGPLDAHGRLDPEEQRRIAACAVVEVIRPAARLLLGRAAAPVEQVAVG